MFVLIISLFVSMTCGCQHLVLEPMMVVALVAAVSFASAYYFSTTTRHHLFYGVHIGLLWLGVNLMLDAVVLTFPFFKPLLLEYMRHIGVAYFVVLIIPFCFEYAFSKKRKS